MTDSTKNKESNTWVSQQQPFKKIQHNQSELSNITDQIDLEIHHLGHQPHQDIIQPNPQILPAHHIGDGANIATHSDYGANVIELVDRG